MCLLRSDDSVVLNKINASFKEKKTHFQNNSILVVGGLGKMARFLCVFKLWRRLRCNQLGWRTVNISPLLKLREQHCVFLVEEGGSWI